jgi:hypothetical protein
MELDSKLSEWIQSRLSTNSPTTNSGCFVDRVLAEKFGNPCRDRTDIMCDLKGQWDSADRIGKLLVNSLSNSNSEECAQGTLLYGEEQKHYQEVKPRNLEASLVNAPVNMVTRNGWDHPGIVDQFKVYGSAPSTNYNRKASGIMPKDETDVWHKTVPTTVATSCITYAQVQTQFQPVKIDNGTALWHKSHSPTWPSQTSVPPIWNSSTRVHVQPHMPPSDDHISSWKPHQVVVPVYHLYTNSKLSFEPVDHIL